MDVVEHPIVFFDGVCNLCNRLVDFLIRRDRKRVFRYASLQGETAARLLPSDRITDLNSFVLLDKDGMHLRSTAALRVLKGLGGVWSPAAAFLLVPRFIRDGVYNWIAGRRYRIWGRRDTCRIPSEAERELLLP